ncbi:MAG TPA: hybrid sensor histidine kinase/response regulator [Acidimicrobiia bacterium]|nr:hybrid sensor histidine kinase/response regulator [Acidimicrobiia bacterium]
MTHQRGVVGLPERGPVARFADEMLRLSPDVFSVVDGDGTIVEVAGAADAVLRMPAADLVHASVFASPVAHPDDVARIAAIYRRLLAGEIEREESRYRLRPDGGPRRAVEASRRILRGHDGAIEGVMVVERTVTSQVRLEEELRAAQETAERADHAKDEFLSRMSHELRTPLNAVIGFGRLLARDDLTADQHDGIVQILKGGELLLELINEVLDISRVASGRLMVAPEAIALAPAVDDAATLIRPMATTNDVTVSVTGDRTLQVFVDKQRLAQILLNLLSNAVKYNRHPGSITVMYAAADGVARIDVRDTGIGLSPDALARMFNPFDRLGAERTTVEGTGLGLVVVKGLVETMGGTIAVTSEEGVGSTFSVTLPLAAVDDVKTEPVPVARPIREAGEREHLVLYIEDNLANAKLVERILDATEGFRYLPAREGRLGLDLARQTHPAVVLLDLNLPDLDGEEVLAALRADPATAAVPVVVLSADATPGRIQRVMGRGASAYLAKPFDVDELLDKLAELCDAPTPKLRSA